MRISGLILCLLVIACAPVCARSSSIDNLPLGVASPTPSPKAQSGTSNPGDGAAKRSSALPPEKANPVKMSKVTEGPETRVPWVGEHTGEVLAAELGLSADALAALRDRGVIT